MADKTWIMFGVPGVGDIAAWVEEGSLASDAQRIPAENLTHLILDPARGIALRKVCASAVLNLSAIMYWLKVPSDIRAGLAKAWDTGEIVAPTDGDRKRFRIE